MIFQPSPRSFVFSLIMFWKKIYLQHWCVWLGIIQCHKTLQKKCWGVSPTDGLAFMWHIPAKLSSAQSRRAVTKNGCNVHDCVKLRRGFSQLSFMHVLFSFNIFLITHFRVVLSFQPPIDHNNSFFIEMFLKKVFCIRFVTIAIFQIEWRVCSHH